MECLKNSKQKCKNKTHWNIITKEHLKNANAQRIKIKKPKNGLLKNGSQIDMWWGWVGIGKILPPPSKCLKKIQQCLLSFFKLILVSPGYTSLRPWSLHSSCDNPTETISACISLGDQPSFSNLPYHHRLSFIISIIFISPFIKKTIKDGLASPYTPY